MSSDPRRPHTTAIVDPGTVMAIITALVEARCTFTAELRRGRWHLGLFDDGVAVLEGVAYVSGIVDGQEAARE